jgi:hypothetical protein
MRKPYTGGCACGATRYAVHAEPISQSHCQCRDCRRMSGTGHGSYLTFASRKDVALKGSAKEWQPRGDSGHGKSRAFCPNCGSPLYMTLGLARDLFIIHAASLDDPARFQPPKVMYGSSGHPWDRHDEALPKLEKLPPR